MFEYLDKEGVYTYRTFETSDLDYFNIRHWRSIYTSFAKEISKNPDKVVHLKIVPAFTDVIQL